MAKATGQVVIDAALDKIAGATTLIVTSGQPASRAAALSSALASVSVSAGDFTKAAGDVSGRKVTVASKASVSIIASGTADHVCLIDATDLLEVTTCTGQALTSGGTVTIGSWKHEINAPT